MIVTPRQARWLAAGMAGILLVAACAGAVGDAAAPPTESSSGGAEATPGAASSPSPTDPPEGAYEMVTLWPPDAIPAIDDPQFYDILGAELAYQPEEMVLGVEINGDARAYPVGVLALHEIVNDTVGGQPIAVTY